MADIIQASKEDNTSTRPRLQAINQDFSDLNEQIRQAAQIIGLPSNWTSIQEKEDRLDIIRRLVRARAEWVLRWILDKLKDETDVGKVARGTSTAWHLLDWMIQVLPASRSAPHLRDAGLPSILERTLFESCGTDPSLQSVDSADVHMKDASESSSTIQDETSPSRKRKRGTNGTISARKSASKSAGLDQLFRVLRSTMHTIMSIATVNDHDSDSTQAELMKMVLRTDSAQASRILRFWLTGVHQLMSSAAITPATISDQDNILDLSVVAEIWDLRSIGTGDEAGASAEEFNTECLVPTLLLHEALGVFRVAELTLASSASLDRATHILDRLLARHLLAPSRAAFFAEATAEAAKASSVSEEATVLAGYLGPLRSKLLQAAQIEDAGEALPADLMLLFEGVAHLLELTIRASPSRTPRGRLAEKPWIQAIFATLAECAGCSLSAPPEFITGQPAVAALQSALRVLKVHNISLKSGLVKKLFWYYCGVKYPERQEKQIHWSLIASLIDLEPSVFVEEPKHTAKTSQEQQSDLTAFLFEQIAAAEVKDFGFDDLERLKTPAWKDRKVHIHADDKTATGRALILNGIIVPLMGAFVQNRNLLGFIRRWDDQLVRTYSHDYQKALKGRSLIWEERTINGALATLFEQSLTQGQIATLLEEHEKRLSKLGNAMDTAAEEAVRVTKLAAYTQASSSAVIVPVILQSIKSDAILEALKSQLLSLFLTYASWVRDDRYSFHTRLDASWSSLCQLFIQLWPIELHRSQNMQRDLVHPLLEKAVKDMATTTTKKDVRRTVSTTPAAAIIFLFEACDCLQTVSGSEEIIRTSLGTVLTILNPGTLGPEYSRIIDIFCARFASLLGCMDADESLKLLSILLPTLAKSPTSDEDLVFSSLAHSVFENGNLTLQNGYAAALLRAFQDDKDGLHGMVAQALLRINPSALSRETREAFLNRSVELLDKKHEETVAIVGLMAHLMIVPNATAKISTNGKTLFDIASKPGMQGFDTPTLIQLFRQLVQSTLGHILPNHTQPQAMSFITQFSSKVDQIAKASENCTALKLSILRAAVPFQDTTTLLKLRPYIELLKSCLTVESEGTASLEDVLDAFNELPSSALEKANLLKPTQAWLQTWVNDNSDLESYITSEGASLLEVAEYAARLHRTVAKFKLYPNVQWLIKLTLRVVRDDLPGRTKDMAYDSVKEALKPLQVYEKLDLVSLLSDVESSANRAASYRILSIVISTLDDRLEANTELKQTQLALLPRVCVLLAESPDYDCFCALLNCVNTILNNKPSLASQYSIECVLSALVKITSRSSPPLFADHASSIYAHLCETARLILLVHRGRLGGRFHILLPLLQGLLFCLFIPNTSRSGALPAWLRSRSTESIRLTPANATQYSRLLATLCNPPQSSITKAHQHRASGKSKDLNDPVKAAREKTSAFLYPLLASYCRFTLSGRLDAGVREKLLPGIWEVVGTASLHKETLDAMFAGLGRSERDVWRGVWREWEGLFGRKAVVVHGE
jgi:nucleolar pre-ribosomal-associated protein 2